MERVEVLGDVTFYKKALSVLVPNAVVHGDKRKTYIEVKSKEDKEKVETFLWALDASYEAGWLGVGPEEW